MATQLIAVSAVIPVGTPLAAPATVDVSFAPMRVETIRWRVPRGSQGVMGWQLSSSGAQVIPETLGAYMITSGESGLWPLERLHTSGDWHVTGYNTGAYPHTVYLEFFVGSISRPFTTADRVAAIASLAMANLAPAYQS